MFEKKEQINDAHILAHTKWNCKYHIVFAPKYRRKVFYNEQRKERCGTRNHTDAVPMERCRHHRRGDMPGSHSPFSKYSAQNERFGIYGVSQREEQYDDIPKI